MNVPELRSAGVDGTGVTVAVIDTGVDYTHPELPLGTKTVNLYDAIDRDGDAQDGYGHGTPVAGIIAGLQSGVARGAKVAAVRVLDNRGEGTDANVLEGLDAVLASLAAGNPHGIRVVNMSLGGYFDDTKPPEPGSCDVQAPDYKAAFDLLSQAGVLVVAASGNGGCTNGIVLPACVSNALAVGAVYDASVGSIFFGRGQCLTSGCSDGTPAADAVACYSDSSDRLDVLAPSHCAQAPRRGGGSISCFGGTSGAAPYAAGVAALLFGAEPAKGPIEVKAAMRSTGKPITDARNGITRNRLDAPSALASLRSAPQGTARAELFVPVVLDVTGLGGARFVSELTLTNRGTTSARLEATYTAATGMFPEAGGSGTVVDSLSPGEQRVIPDAISWLRSGKGLGIPAGSGQAGTLRLVFTGLSHPEMAAARVRTAAASCNGAAGLSYPAWTAGETSTTNLQLFGLRSSAAERTNLAVVNAGTEGTVTLKVVLRSGDGASVYEVPSSLLPPLGPGEWRQVNDADLLRAAGFTDATARHAPRWNGAVRRLRRLQRQSLERRVVRPGGAGRVRRRGARPAGRRRDERLRERARPLQPCHAPRARLAHLRGVAREPEGNGRYRERRPRPGPAADPPPHPRHAPLARSSAGHPRRSVVRGDALHRVHAPCGRSDSRPGRREDGRGGNRRVRREGELRALLPCDPGGLRSRGRSLRRRPPADGHDALEPRPVQPLVHEPRDGPVRGPGRGHGGHGADVGLHRPSAARLDSGRPRPARVRRYRWLRPDPAGLSRRGLRGLRGPQRRFRPWREDGGRELRGGSALLPAGLK
ncbi:MAG: S8 family serine peptidase [Holophagales bacterium]|nr:S8 family serine peptidase [Holophagales bacterium]